MSVIESEEREEEYKWPMMNDRNGRKNVRRVCKEALHHLYHHETVTAIVVLMVVCYGAATTWYLQSTRQAKTILRVR